MFKPKQSIAMQRQIPEHIRLGYPLFVEFLKSYYDFLEQTQSQELEKIRDIDTSLDEFINRFTSEISTGIPFSNVQDKRMLIKHLREFYLSRGSEASFKFLFRTLFDKEAELFYPSAQVLRVSDGKWRQDVSIFVKVTEGVETLLPLNGNYIELTTTRELNGKNITKTFRTYVDRVLEYSTGTYELYIQRDYVNEINIGTRISFTDDQNVNYSGNVLPCPTKLSIYKAGRGFKVGDIFALKTSIGNGCVIKVSKIGQLGEIKSIKLIRVGLDYETTFYSYLSSAKLEAIEYVLPARLNHPYVPGEPAYNERSGGFVDYGFANKQTYFDYDSNIPVGNPSFASDRFFADSSYVGDIETQFYAEDINNPIDETLAIIQIDLGAVAKYPGYYETQDGFISDEMFIQDGNYYQAYSYVIKVEEELRKYADVVRKILHPAGMKLFSEYNITNVLSLAAVKKALLNTIERVDNITLLDQGIGYTKYNLLSDDPNNIVYVPDLDSPKVFTPFGKLAYYVDKKLNDLTIAADAPSKLVSKPIEGDNAVTFDSQVKLVEKALAEVLFTSEVGYNYDSYIHTFVNGEVIVSPDPNSMLVYSAAGKTAQYVVKKLVETIVGIEEQAKLVDKPLSDNFVLSDISIKEVIKNHFETITYDETSVKEVIKNHFETISLLDLIEKLVDKPLSEIISLSDGQSKLLHKSLSEIISLSDENVKEYSKQLSEIITQFVTKVIDFSKVLEEILVINDAQSKEYQKQLLEILTQEDNYSLLVDKAISDIFFILDSSVREVIKNITETVTVDDLNNKQYFKYNDEFITLEDFIQIAREFFYNEMIEVFDAYFIQYDKYLEDIISTLDNNVKSIAQTREETINITSRGAIYKNPYDAEMYFAPEDQYQANTPIT